MEKAEEHILLVCANLDAEVISTVKENESELKQFANIPQRKVLNIAKNDRDPFEKIVSQVNIFLFERHPHFDVQSGVKHLQNQKQLTDIFVMIAVRLRAQTL